WNGPETQAEINARANEFTQAFHQKWGAALSYAFLGSEWNLFRSDETLAWLLGRKDFTRIVERLHAQPSLDAFIQRQGAATVAAICVSPEAGTSIERAVNSIYDVCHAVVVLGDKPDTLADPARKICTVSGKW